MKAMLYVEADSRTVSNLLEDPDWVLEQKFDGARVIAKLDGAVAGQGTSRWSFYQRDGKPLKFAAAAQWLPQIERELNKIPFPEDTVLDGELTVADGAYHVFDLLGTSWESLDMASAPFLIRRGALEALFGGTGKGWPTFVDQKILHVVEQWRWNKAEALKRLRERGVEGAMLKNRFAVYEAGTRVKTTSAVKVKFVKDADVIVTSWSRPDHRTGSATLGAYDADGNLVTVGACSLIGKEAVEVGDVITASYLYWTGSCMYQPRMVSKRTDKLPTECTTSQFNTYSREVVTL